MDAEIICLGSSENKHSIPRACVSLIILLALINGRAASMREDYKSDKVIREKMIAGLRLAIEAAGGQFKRFPRWRSGLCARSTAPPCCVRLVVVIGGSRHLPVGASGGSFVSRSRYIPARSKMA